MKTLIIYSSRRGSTEQCAEKLKNKIKGDVTLINFKQEIPTLTDYDTVIIGASILGGKIFPRLKKYSQENELELSRKNIALFVCSGDEREEAVEKMFQDNYPESVVNKALVKTTFGGILELAREGIIMRFILKMMGKKDDYNRIKPERIKNFADVINNIRINAV